MRKKFLPNPAEAAGADPPRRVISSPPLELHLSRSIDRFESIQLKEPELVFGENHRCVDLRAGLAAYGPFKDANAANSGQLRVGIVGTGEAIKEALSLLEEISRPIEQDPKLDCIRYPSFPGLNSGLPFSVDVLTQTSWHKSINSQLVRLAADCGDSNAKYGMLRELYGAQVRAMSQLEFPPNVVICALPARVESSILKAACAQYLPTEIVCDGKITEADGPHEDRATEAWNLTVRLLYKAGLTPCRLADATSDSCFAGVSVHREHGSMTSEIWTSFAHVVTDLGIGFTLKGETIECSPKKEGDAPDLGKEHSARLMSRVLDAYRKSFGRSPSKVVVHKSSPFCEAERAGFVDSLRGFKQHALISVKKSAIFFLRSGRKHIPRGAVIPFGEKLGIVYVSGYVPFLKCYPGNRMPQPFEITENWGSLTFQEAAIDLLRLTKLNWNTSAFCSEVPATLALPGEAREIFRILGQHDLVLNDRFCM